MKKFLLPLLIVPLLSLTACWNTSTPEPVAPVETAVTVPAEAKPASTDAPSIDEQMEELQENRGDISDEDRQKLNDVPVVPDVFGK